MPISLLLFVVVIKFPATFFLFSIIFFLARDYGQDLLILKQATQQTHIHTLGYGQHEHDAIPF